MLRILILLFCLGCSSCFSQTDKSLLDNWTSYPIPTNPDTLRKYNFSENEWSVLIKNNIVHVIKKPSNTDMSIVPFKINSGSKTKLSALQVDNGFLIGSFSGEWGGNLNWFSKDGRDHYEISKDEIVQFIKRDEKIYAIQGLAHLSSSFGSIISVEKENGKWVAKEYLKLPTAPDAMGLDSNNNFIIVTSKSLLKIDTQSKITTLIGKGIWYDGLYTNSLVIKDNVVYAGMRAGVYKYNLLTGNQEWLLPY